MRAEYFTEWEGLRKLLAGNKYTVNASHNLYYSLGSPPDPIPIPPNI